MLVVVAVAVASAAFAQGQSRTLVNIEFGFVAAGQTMPAGKYAIEITPDAGGTISLTGPKHVLLPSITRLGRHDNDQDAELVFDKVAGAFLLSEVWLSGDDGYLLLATKGPHAHHVVGGSHPTKVK
jgi:hypothetical protein